MTEAVRADFQGERGAWNTLIAALPGAHFLQTWEWGEVKRVYGWTPRPQVWRDGAGSVVAAALLLERRAAIAGIAAARLLYAPRGPLLAWDDASLRRQVLADLVAYGRERGAMLLKLDPDVTIGWGETDAPDSRPDPVGLMVQAELDASGWQPAAEQIQFANTVVLDLRPSEAALLAAMKQKTRYNLRLAEKKGVTVRRATAADWPLLYQMYAETSLRDGFAIRAEAYYRTVWDTFTAAGMGVALIAEAAGEPLAGLFLTAFAGQAWYFYGMSRPIQREKMPNFLLQWEAIRWARAAGCHTYDLWGAPEVFAEADSMWGVYRFKMGLGGTVRRGLGAYDFPLQPLAYRLYTQILPRIMAVLRRRGAAAVERKVNA
jgi:lipid II:glycine glycyltransferase (peptidoglycan interpeptide bridge formation enzyme)